MSGRVLSGCLVLFLLSLFTGCAQKEDIRKVDLSKTSEIKNDADNPLKIRIGLIPEQNIQAMASRYEPLAGYLSKRLNRTVDFVYLDNYAEVCERFIYKQLDAAFFGSFSYILTHAKTGVEPIARPDYAGVSTYRGIIIVRADSGIKKVSDMKGKRLALVHRATYAGYLYPLYYFNRSGVTDLKAYFSSVTFAGSHDKAIAAVLREEADVTFAKDLVYQRMIKENPSLESKLNVLAVSDPVPSNAFCVSQGMDPPLKARLKEILGHLGSDPEAKGVLDALGGASKFVETNDKDYGPLYAVTKALGIDLNAYPFYERPDMGFESKKAEGRNT